MYSLLVLLSLVVQLSISSTHTHRYNRGLSTCSSMPLSFRRRWQVIGEKGRQLWINKYNLRVLGPVDDVFGAAAGGGKLIWYTIKCDDEMVQLKVVLSESRSEDSGEYMCLRLTRLTTDVIGLVVRQRSKVSSKYRIDCEFWSDSRTRKAYKFHLTDNPSWADLLSKEDAVVKASSNMTMKKCGNIPEGFHGDWRLANSNKVVEFRKKYYRAYGAHGNDPFWRTNTELTFFSLTCNPTRVIAKLYLWELPAGSRSQLQCVTLTLDGEYDLVGHAVNMIASKAPGSNAPPEVDCDHNIGKDYTRYPLHLSRQLTAALAPKPIHTMSAAPQLWDNEEMNSHNWPRLPGPDVETPWKSFEDGDSYSTPAISRNIVEDEQTEEVMPFPDKSENQLIDEILATSHLMNWLTAAPSSKVQHQQAELPGPMYSPHPYLPYYPQWTDKRDGSGARVRKLLSKRIVQDNHDSVPRISNKQLVRALNKQSRLLQNILNKMSYYMDMSLATTTKDWNYIEPYLKHDVKENVQRKGLTYDYYGDD